MPFEKFATILTEKEWLIFRQRNFCIKGGYSFTSAASTDINQFEFISKGWENSNHPVTRALHNAKVGDIFFVSSGQGRMFYESSMSSIVLIGGGIGMTPFLSIIRSVQNTKVKVLLSAKKEEYIPQLQELKQLIGEENIFITLTDANPTWTGYTGRLDYTKITKALGSNIDKSAHYFICGPWNMIQDIASIFLSIGVPDDHVHVENWDI